MAITLFHTSFVKESSKHFTIDIRIVFAMQTRDRGVRTQGSYTVPWSGLTTCWNLQDHTDRLANKPRMNWFISYVE